MSPAASGPSKGRRPRSLFSSTPRVTYVGWIGHGNVGDEAMLLAHRRALPAWDIVASNGSRERTVWPRRHVAGTILGGGTLIGWPGYRRRVVEVLDSEPDSLVFTLGTGVEDPDSAGANSTLVASLARAASEAGRRHAGATALLEDELERWAETLVRFRSVLVRGPRSCELLARFGVEAEAVGDSALLLADQAPASTGDSTFEERLLGLNIGPSTAMPAERGARLLDVVVRVARTMVERGWRIQLLPFYSRDVAQLAELARALGPAAELETSLEIPTLLDALRRCHVVLGQKLHSVVLASAVYVPCASLAYHPKCTEFQASLGRERYAFPDQAAEVEQLVDAVEELAANRDRHRAALVSAVARCRQRLLTHAEEIARVLTTRTGGDDSRPPEVGG